MSEIKRDGEHIIIKIPQADLDSMVRWIAHNVVSKSDRVKDLATKIVEGDLSLQDLYAQSLIETLGIDDWALVLDGVEALSLCDELANTIYDEQNETFGPLIKTDIKPTLRIVKVCVECQKGFIKGESHNCVVK